MKRRHIFVFILCIGLVVAGIRYVQGTFEQYYKMLDHISIQDEEKEGGILQERAEGNPIKKEGRETRSNSINLWSDFFQRERIWQPSILLLYGMDAREGIQDKGRPDTLMLALLDPEQTELSLISLPRDSYVNIPGYKRHKLNTSFARGGVDLTMQTIEEWLGIILDGYVSIDFQGFEELVDLIGGIEVDVDKDMQYQLHKPKSKIDLYAGRQTLQGKEALDFVRFRHNDNGEADTDYQRMARQQQVLEEIGKELISLRTFSRMEHILNILGEHVKTSLSMEEIDSLIKKYATFKVSSLEKTILIGEGIYEGGVWYEEIPEKELERIREIIATFKKS